MNRLVNMAFNSFNSRFIKNNSWIRRLKKKSSWINFIFGMELHWIDGISWYFLHKWDFSQSRVDLEISFWWRHGDNHTGSLSTLKTLIFANCWGSEVVGSSCYPKNTSAKFTHSYLPSLCKEFFLMRHTFGHSNGQWPLVISTYRLKNIEISLYHFQAWVLLILTILH